MHSLFVPDTPGAVGAVSGIDQTGLGADFDDTAGDFAITPGGITPGVVPVTPGLWPASAVADVVGTLLGGSGSSHQVSTSDQASGSRKRSSVSIMTHGGSKRKVGRPKSQSTPARSGPAFAEAMEFPDEGPWKSVNANPVPGASVFRPSISK